MRSPLPPALLVVDVGNTHTVAGLYRGDSLFRKFRLSTRRTRTADEFLFAFKQCLEDNPVEGCVVSSVVPVLDEAVKTALSRLTGQTVLMVHADLDLGITVGYDRPSDVGADRLVNAAAAARRYGTPVIIVDFGTAITFCAVDAAGTYRGGAIAPGIGLSLEALTRGAARLHSVELLVPGRVIGGSTEESIQSGLLYGFASLTDGMIGRIKDELGGEAAVVATGGLAPVVVPICSNVSEICSDLTLEGLRMIWKSHRQPAC